MLKPIAQPGTVRQIEYQLIQLKLVVQTQLTLLKLRLDSSHTREKPTRNLPANGDTSWGKMLYEWIVKASRIGEICRTLSPFGLGNGLPSKFN
jgi:hypothetical protein